MSACVSSRSVSAATEVLICAAAAVCVLLAEAALDVACEDAVVWPLFELDPALFLLLVFALDFEFDFVLDFELDLVLVLVFEPDVLLVLPDVPDLALVFVLTAEAFALLVAALLPLGAPVTVLLAFDVLPAACTLIPVPNATIPASKTAAVRLAMAAIL